MVRTYRGKIQVHVPFIIRHIILSSFDPGGHIDKLGYLMSCHLCILKWKS